MRATINQLIVDDANNPATHFQPVPPDPAGARLLVCHGVWCHGLAEMRKGKSPTVRKGPYKGDQLSVDHIIPKAVCPELDNVIANLELMPLRMNESKNAKIGSRQRSLAMQLREAGLLPSVGFKAVFR